MTAIDCTVRFHGVAAEVAGLDEVGFDLPADATVTTLVNRIVGSDPELTAIVEGSTILLNGAPATGWDDPLPDGQLRVDIAPPNV